MSHPYLLGCSICGRVGTCGTTCTAKVTPKTMNDYNALEEAYRQGRQAGIKEAVEIVKNTEFKPSTTWHSTFTVIWRGTCEEILKRLEALLKEARK